MRLFTSSTFVSSRSQLSGFNLTLAVYLLKQIHFVRSKPRYQIRPLKILLVMTFMAASLFITSCESPPKLPEDAKETLLDYWASLPSPTGFEHHIIQAWQGETGTENEITLSPDMETWCVETSVSAPNDPSVDGEKLIWIIVRKNQESRWTAALLATMSSIWPYEACGTTP